MFVYFVVSHWTWNLLRGFISSASPWSSPSRLSSNHHHLLIMIRPVRLPLGLAPRIARLTLAFLPSMIGFGSLHARSAASLFDIITWNIFLSGWEGVIHQINSEWEQNPKRHIIFSNLNQLPIYLCLTSLSIASSCNKNKISTTAVEMLSKTMKVGFVTKSEGTETC